MIIFLLLLFTPVFSQFKVGDLRSSLDVLSARIAELESSKQPTQSKVKVQYYKLFSGIKIRIKDKIDSLTNNPRFLIKFINSSTDIISVLLIQILLAVVFSIFAMSKFHKSEKGIYGFLINKAISRIPEILVLLLPLVSKQLLILLKNFIEPDPLIVCQWLNLFSEISAIFLLSGLIFYFFQRIAPKEAKTILIYIFFISFIRICKILLRFFISLDSINGIGDFDNNIGQVEAISVFLIVIMLLIRVRKLSYSLPRFDKILPYITIIAGFCTLLAYLTNNQSIRFMYKLFMSLLTWPLLYHLTSIFRNWTREYLSNLPRTGTTSFRKPIEIWLIITNLLQFMTIPISLIIAIYIFDLTPLIESRFILQNVIFQRICFMFPLYFSIRICSLANSYISDIYIYINSENRPFDSQRIRTSGKIIRYLGTVLIYIVAIFSLLSIFGYNVTPLFQTIGLFSAALTFSLQQLIRDLINGICILYENSIKIGDWIDHEGKTAVVEDMSLRYIRARLDDGLLVTIPFHKLDIIKNKSRYHSYIVYNLSIARSVPIEETEIATNEAFFMVSERPEFKYKIISKEIELRDIADVTGFSYIFQFRIAVQPQSQNKIKRAFNRELLKIFEEREIKIAMPMVANATNVPSFTTGDPYPDFQ